MVMHPLQFLLLEDSSLDAELIQANLLAGGVVCELVRVDTQADFVTALENRRFDLILSDYSLPNFDGIAALEVAHSQWPELPFIFVSATLGEELAIEAMKRGATDYVLKQRLQRLVPAVKRALREAQERHERQQAERSLKERNERLKLLFETASDLLSAEQPLTLMNSLFKKLSVQLDLHYYFNFLVDESGPRRRLRLSSYGGISDDEAESIACIEFGQYMCGLIAQEGRQIAVENVQCSLHPNAQVIRSLGITAYSGQPLVVQGRLLGTLSFASLTRTHFTPEELALLQATSDQIAIALERAELIASLQKQTEQLTQANQIKDEFLAVLSHELRTPLNPILGWAKLLQVKACDPATTARALETIERNAKIQTQLIEDLLDVSRILRGKLNLIRNEVDLVPTVATALETVHLAAEAKKINVRFEVLDSLGGQFRHSVITTIEDKQILDSTLFKHQKILVLGDTSRLQQVIWNLLSNAVKFTPPDGRITISLSVITKENSQQEMDQEEPMRGNATIDYAQIQVTDTGQGISEAFLPHVFEYFRQAEGGTTRKFGGLGLGLAIAQHIVQAHGGTLQATSPGVGKGATFTVQLPLLKTQPATSLDPEQHAPSSHTSRLLNNLRVLVVDDEPDTLELITFLLRQEGAIVHTAACVREALVAFEEFQPELLISDIGMPEADGYALLHQLHKQIPATSKKIPAIALTAFARDEDRHRAISAGFQRHLAKPINPADLISIMAELVV